MTPPLVEPAIGPWSIDPAGFPASGSVDEQLCFLVGYAVLAPSGHNAQPWLFRVGEGALELHADRTRALPVVDPDDRELTVSCGAALFNLRAAMRAFGFDPRVARLPDPADPDLLARVAAGTRRVTAPDDDPLFRAIPRRRTNRRPFEARAVPDALVGELQAAALREGARLVPVHDHALRYDLVELVQEGDRAQWAERPFRRELAAWVHSNHSRAQDGIRGYGLRMGDVISAAAPMLMRTFDLGDRTAASDRSLADHSPLLAVLSTDQDTPAAWLAAGEALEHVLLAARAADVWASFLNQPVEVPSLRSRLQRLTGGPPYPQIVMRLGYGPEPAPEPRRPVADVLLR